MWCALLLPILSSVYLGGLSTVTVGCFCASLWHTVYGGLCIVTVVCRCVSVCVTVNLGFCVI